VPDIPFYSGIWIWKTFYTWCCINSYRSIFVSSSLIEWIKIWAFYYFHYWVRLIFSSGSWYHPLAICWARINANKDCCKCCCTAWCPRYCQHIPGQSCWCIWSHNNFGGEFCVTFQRSDIASYLTSTYIDTDKLGECWMPLL